MSEMLIPRKGNYKKLLSYQKTEVIFEMTYYFCHNYLQRGDRTIDQMVQAARSGKQNIVEGCAASATSNKTEIKLVSVAKASLQGFLKTMRTICVLVVIGNGKKVRKNWRRCVV